MKTALADIFGQESIMKLKGIEMNPINKKACLTVEETPKHEKTPKEMNHLEFLLLMIDWQRIIQENQETDPRDKESKR